jgi:hypothetical protein
MESQAGMCHIRRSLRFLLSKCGSSEVKLMLPAIEMKLQINLMKYAAVL